MTAKNPRSYRTELRQRGTWSCYRPCDKLDKPAISCTYDTDNSYNLMLDIAKCMNVYLKMCERFD